MKVTLWPSKTVAETVGEIGADVATTSFAIVEALVSSLVTRIEPLLDSSRPAIVLLAVIDTDNVGVDCSAVPRVSSLEIAGLAAVGSAMVELAEGKNWNVKSEGETPSTSLSSLVLQKVKVAAL